MKNIVVVGGTKGIGKSIIDLLDKSNVFVLARTKNELPDTANTHFIGADVTVLVNNYPCYLK